jgi:hypothetical protein
MSSAISLRGPWRWREATRCTLLARSKLHASASTPRSKSTSRVERGGPGLSRGGDPGWYRDRRQFGDHFADTAFATLALADAIFVACQCKNRRGTARPRRRSSDKCIFGILGSLNPHNYDCCTFVRGLLIRKSGLLSRIQESRRSTKLTSPGISTPRVRACFSFA